MAEASISVDQDQFSCSVCLDLLKDPVTINCGHSYCLVCINEHWDQEDQRRIYSCPQCRKTFTPRPELFRNNVMAEVVEKLKKKQLQAASPAHCYAGAGDVECDFCTGSKRKASLFCEMCQASYCETHLIPHYEVPALKKHKMIRASPQLAEKICSQHDKLIEIYCRTDQSCICYLCTMDEHRGHDTVSATAGRKEKQPKVKEVQMEIQQRSKQKEKKLQEVKQVLNTLKVSAESAVEDSEMIFTELISFIEKKYSEITEQIRAQETTEQGRAEELLEKLEQEITDLKRRNTELEQLLHTDDHIHFLQSFKSLCGSSGSDDSTSFTVHQHLSFDEVRKSLSDLKKRLEEFCKEEIDKIHPHVATVHVISPLKPKTREDFLQCFRHLTVDPITLNEYLILDGSRVVKWCRKSQPYSDRAERFDYWHQVLCTEGISGHCYWEVEWSSKGQDMSISVSYKTISRKGQSNECCFGHNNQSWSLQCFPSLSFWHNNIKTKISAPSSSRIGVYVDHSAGTLSFYSISDRMTLLHTVHTTFTQPLYAGFGVDTGSSVKLCDLK